MRLVQRSKILLHASTLLLLTMITTPVFAAANLSVYILPGTVARQQIVNEYVVPEFEKRNPGVKVEILSGTFTPDKLKTLVAGGLAPDIAYIRLENFPDLVYTGLYEPLDAYLKTSSLRLDNIPAVAMDSFKYNGKIYGVPYDSLAFNVTTLYINKDMFSRAGLKAPKVDFENPHSGWTYDDMTAYAKKMTIDRNGDGTPEEYGFLVAPYSGFVGNGYRLVWNWGGDIISQAPGGGWRSEVTNPQTLKAFQWVHDMKFEHKVVGGDFLAGTRAMHIEAFGYLSTIANRNPSFDWTLAAVPRGAGGRWGLTHVNPMGIMKSSKNKDIAFKFLEFWLSDDVQVRMADAGALPPQTYSVARRRSFMFTDTPPYDKSPFFFGQSRSLPVWAPNWNDIQVAFTDAMKTVINNPEVPVGNVVATLNDKVLAALK